MDGKLHLDLEVLFSQQGVTTLFMLKKKGGGTYVISSSFIELMYLLSNKLHVHF